MRRLKVRLGSSHKLVRDEVAIAGLSVSKLYDNNYSHKSNKA